MTAEDPWSNLKRFTDARIGLGRSGSAMPTREVLGFALAHAMARDAVLTPLDWDAIDASALGLGLETKRVASAVSDRIEYLRRPDLGRQLSAASRQSLSQHTGRHPGQRSGTGPDLVIIAADGLSSKAVAANFEPMLAALLPFIRQKSWTLGPIVLAEQARVALGDDAGEIMGARAVLMLIGERPGLSSPDSLGAYLTYQPRVGLTDADRNCVSNIRVRGLSYQDAAFKLTWLLDQAFKRQMTGVALKDESNAQIEGRPNVAQLT
jgi:ethanolamine ammonia-lyase small subunit